MKTAIKTISLHKTPLYRVTNVYGVTHISDSWFFQYDPSNKTKNLESLLHVCNKMKYKMLKQRLHNIALYDVCFQLNDNDEFEWKFKK